MHSFAAGGNASSKDLGNGLKRANLVGIDLSLEVFQELQP